MRQLFFSGAEWPGGRRVQVAAAREWFERWVVELPVRREWLEHELRLRGGPPVPGGVDGLGAVVEWIETTSGPRDAPPAGCDVDSLSPAAEWGSGNPWWDAAAAGLTAVIADVMRDERPVLELVLVEDRGNVDDLLPKWADPWAPVGPWKLARAALYRFREEGDRDRLERAIRVNLETVPRGEGAALLILDERGSGSVVQVYVELDPGGDGVREFLVNVDESAAEVLGEAAFGLLEGVFAAVEGVESIEQMDRDEFEAVLTPEAAADPQVVRARLQAALDALR